MRTDPLETPADEHLESRFQHRFRWAAIAGLCLMAVAVTRLEAQHVRYISTFLIGYLLHGFLHSLDMTTDYRKLTRSWATLHRYREKLKAAEQQIMTHTTEQKS